MSLSRHRPLPRSLSVLSLALLAALGFVPVAQAASDVVIGQVYGGGGNSSAPFTNDFVELFNRGATTVSLSGWSIQYASATGPGNFGATATQLTELSGSIAPGQYLLIQQASSGAIGVPLPTPDLIDTTPINMSGTAGKVALVSSTSSLGCNGGSTLCSPSALALIVDLVGYGNANFFEGSGAAPAPSNTTAALRAANGCIDTDNNASDFATGAPNPRNGANPLAVCGGSPAAPVVNEFVANHTGADTHEFLEVKGDPSTDYSAYAVLQIEGDGTGQGVIDSVHVVGTTDANGLWTSAFLGNVLENGSITLLLVKHFSGAVGNDIDANNDGLLDTSFWSAIVDSVAVSDGGSGDSHYSAVVLAPGFDGDPFGPGGASRIPNGADTDSVADWRRNDFDGAGLPGFTGTPVFGEAFNTPGAANAAVPEPPPTLVINEIDYDQPGTDAAEFIEIKNTGTSPANLDPVSLVLVNGNAGGAAVYQVIDLPAVTLAPGGYFVVCGDAANVINCDLDVSPNTNLVQNGAPDAVALVSDSILLDAVSYEGNTGAPYTEGSGVGLEDDPGVAFLGISRFPDGTDTNQNNLDLSARCITPGSSNAVATTGCSEPVRSAIVINEIDYDQPGSDTAEFIELKNVSGAAVDLDPYELRLVNGLGGGAAVYLTIDLPAVSLAPGGYFVVCGNAASVAHCDLDVSPDDNLIQNGAPDAVGLALSGTLVDAVSYEGDTGAPYTEGSGVGLEDDPGFAFRGLSRFPDGADTDRNNVDLSPRCITPGGPNTVFTSNCTPDGPVFEIFEIQGAGLASPFVGGVLSTKDNIVTALAPDGFFIQTPDARADASRDTSNGIFVFTGAAPAVAVGDQVDVTGTVAEFFNFTELSGNPIVTVDSAGNALPAAVSFDAAVPSPDPAAPSCAIEYECYEGMRISVRGGTVGGPNQRFGTDPIAEVHVVAGPARAFREPGILFPGLPGLPVWDGNPEVFELDPDRLGLSNQVIPAGSRFDADGVLGFEFGGYELWPTALSVTPATLPRAVAPRQAGEFTVGSLNLFRLFDDVNDPGSQDDGAVVSTAEYQRRLAKFSAYIREVLDAPDVLAVEEAEKLGVLLDLAARIAADAPGVVYSAYLVEGNDVGGIDTGFLVRDTVTVSAVTQLGAAETLSVDGSLLHDRPPLLLAASYVGGGASFPIQVMAVHNRSLGGIEDPVDGPRVRQKRLEQAQSIAQKVQDLQLADAEIRLVVIGDFNAFEFSDGFVDAVGQIAGAFDPAENLLSGPDLVSPDLTVQTKGVPLAERYSFVFSGSAQAIDHALTSSRLGPLVRGVEYGRGNADAAVDLINDATTPLRSSDHDGLVLRIFADSDGDGVADQADACPATLVPESVPTSGLGVNRYALVDGDRTFDTAPPPGRGNGPGDVFTLDDTAGCSCEQIIAARGLGQGHTTFGCSVGVMRDWVRDH